MDIRDKPGSELEIQNRTQRRERASVNVKGVRKTESSAYNLSGLFDPLFRGFFSSFFYVSLCLCLSLITSYFISCSLFLFNVLSLFFFFFK